MDSGSSTEGAARPAEEVDGAAPGQPVTIGGRYQLLTRSGADEDTGAGRLSTWRARDTLLRRDVLLRIHAPGGAAARGFIDRALAAGVLSHPALAMVYDAVDENRRAYVVSEWVEGTSLAEQLLDGPLAEPDARETVRRVAEGVTQAHELGLAVGGLLPQRVILTPSGSVTVAAIPAPAATQDADVRALGALLFATVTGAMPVEASPGPGTGPGTGPESGTEPGSGSVVDTAELDRQLTEAAPDAPTDLAEIALAALDGRLGTAGEIVSHLLAGRRRGRGYDIGYEVGYEVGYEAGGYGQGYEDRGSGTEDAGLAFITDHYEYDTAAPGEDSAPGAAMTASPSPTSSGPAREDGDRTGRTRPISAADLSAATAAAAAAARGRLPAVADATVGSPPPASAPAAPAGPAPPAVGADPRPHVDADAEADPEVGGGRRRTWLALAFPVAALLAVALIGWVIGSSFGGAPGGTPAAQTTAATSTTAEGESTSPAPSPTPEPTPEPAPGPLSVVSATVYDPFGDGEPENNDESPLAFDGDPATSWPTLTYRGSPLLGNLKPGVGLVFDLGQEAVVSEVTISTDQAGATVEVRSGAQPTGDIEAFPVAAQGEVGEQTTLPVDSEQPARYWLVWITELVPDGGDFSASLGEVAFTGVPSGVPAG